MRNTIFTILLVLLASCSTTNNKYTEKKKTEIEEQVKEDRIVGKDLPSWTNKGGVENGKLFVVGYAEFGLNKSPYFIKKAALMDAESKLLSEAPTDFRVIAQNAITGAGMDSSEFFEIQTKTKEVVGITGIKPRSGKDICRKIVRYGEYDKYVRRACWVMASVPVSNLRKAYARTIALKYGETKANKFDTLMKKELSQIDKKSAYRENDKNQQLGR